jgi:Rod binding domain-containing protein
MMINDPLRPTAGFGGASAAAIDPVRSDLEGLLSGGGTDKERLGQAAEKLEGVFVSMLVETMRKTMSEDGLFGDMPGADVYEGFFDRMMGESIAERGGLGIAEMVVRDGAAARAAISPEELTRRLEEALGSQAVATPQLEVEA